MKKLRNTLLIVLLSVAALGSAQEVNTLFFLENAPMRHIVNPAFQPVSNGYVNFTPLGYMSLWAGNNSLTMRDLIYNYNGKTITALHPQGGDREALYNAFRKATLINTDMTLNILGFGFRYKENGYININITERIDAGTTLPRDLFRFGLRGGMTNLDGVNTFDLSQLGLHVTAYTEIAGGYSHKINEHWTVGGKLKFLLGQAYAGMRNNNITFEGSREEWNIKGTGRIDVAMPIQKSLPNRMSWKEMEKVDFNKAVKDMSVLDWVTPSGYGAAIDIGASYKPIEQVQISFALNDLGFIYWNKGRTYKSNIDTTFTGVGDFDYGHYIVDNKFSIDSLWRDTKTALMDFAKSIRTDAGQDGFARMVNMHLNVGVDANFFNNILGVGVFSKTTLYNYRLYEELTIGAAVRPCNWFNLAVSYSLVNNGKYSNIGAGLSFMPYDGVNMTLAMDYIPTSYAYIDNKIPIPYRDKGFNIALGFSIVWGTNKKDKDSDKDGIFDRLDVCPNTPLNVRVDALGCPLDSDGDGVPDYLDDCPGTPSAAYGFIDTVGCELDTDSDGVYDYLDKCPGTPIEARGYVDDQGCALDTDGDGVPDYLDQCPNTPAEARGFIDEHGCPLDTDSDGVYDYLDECPNTPLAARGFIDERGCELDSDGDSVPDWKDQCPNTPVEARGFIDSVGCELDTDKDGVPDWKDECPTVPGLDYNKGCPEVKKEIRNLLKKAMQGIQFETGKAIIKPVSFPLLNQIAAQFIENKNFIIEVQGHTDNVGKADYNMKLSDARANSVMNYLVKQGVPQERISAKGYGMDVPIADNKTKAGRAKNRRVEFDITFEEVKVETELQHIDSALYRKHMEKIEAMRLDSLRQDSIRQAKESGLMNAKENGGLMDAKKDSLNVTKVQQ